MNMRSLAVIGWLVLVGLQVLILQSTKATSPDVYRQITLRLTEHDRLVAEWKADKRTPESAFLATFLAGIRHDGFALHAAEKQRLNSIAENLQQISGLLQVYKPKRSADEFEKARGDYEKFSAAWADREDSILGLYLLGGELPREPLSFPLTLRAMLASEGS